MQSNELALQRHLQELAVGAQPGVQLPTIRELMKRFGASQAVVQRAFATLKQEGLIESQVGRGTYFLGPSVERTSLARSPVPTRPSAQGAMRSVLLLRRAMSVTRGRVLVEGLQQRFSRDGHNVLEVSYNDPAHARAALKGLPKFDACIVQSSYRTIPIELLMAIRDKAEIVAVDGTSLVGTDVDAVGTEWGEPLASAVAKLRALGHRRIAFAATSMPMLSTQLARRRLEQLQSEPGGELLGEISLPCLPDQDYAGALISRLREMVDSHGQLPFTGLVAWGIEDGNRFNALLCAAQLPVPSALSVVLLGRPDLINEHAGFFTTVGPTVEDQISALHEVVTARWSNKEAPYGVRLVPTHCRDGASLAEPTSAKRAPARAKSAR